MFFRTETLFEKFLVILILDCFYESLTGNKLDEVWIWTPDNGDLDHWTPNVFNYYTNLEDYQVNPSRENVLNFSVLSKGSRCDIKFVLLSARADLKASEYYEIYISPSNIHYRYGGDSGNIVYTYGPVPASCEEFREYSVKWNSRGEITVYNSLSNSSVTMVHPMAPTYELPIMGVGIKTGFGDVGFWKIKHSGKFTGHFCVADQMYGPMDLLMVTSQPRLACAAMCRQTDECLGMNFNVQNNQCEQIRSGQLVVKVPRQGWKFSTKCLNGKELCLACL